MEIIYKTIKDDDYDSVLTIVEYFVQQLERITQTNKESVVSFFNSVFQREFIGYRFVDKKILPISDAIEVNEIEDAINSPYVQVKGHFSKSLEMLSDRVNPDYENSIKESISAVECICSIIIGKPTTLGDALSKLEKSGLSIHPSMRAAFDKLYGYTSDGAGIRHAGKLDGPKSTFEEAKFMLVSCCAFVNYLMGIMSKNNVDE